MLLLSCGWSLLQTSFFAPICHAQACHIIVPRTQVHPWLWKDVAVAAAGWSGFCGSLEMKTSYANSLASKQLAQTLPLSEGESIEL